MVVPEARKSARWEAGPRHRACREAASGLGPAGCPVPFATP